MNALALLLLLQAPPDVTIDAEVGFAGRCFPDAWSRVTVLVHSSGRPFEGGLRVTVSGSGIDPAICTHRLSLNGPTNKRYPWDLHFSGLERDVVVELLDSGGRVLQKQELRIEFIEEGLEQRLLVVGAVTPAVRAAEALGVTLVYLRPDRFPDELLPLLAIDTIVFPAPETLDGWQQEALRRWVAQGGRLVVSTGRRYAAAQNPFWSDLLPVEITGSRVAPLRAGDETVDVLIATGNVRGAILAGSSEEPLIVSAPEGRGTVAMLAFALDEPRLGEVLPPARIWWPLFDRTSAADDEDAARPRVTYITSDAILEKLSRQEPSGAWRYALGMLVLAIYVVFIGPFESWRLHKAGRLKRGWIGFFAATILFSGAVLVGSRLTSPSDTRFDHLVFSDDSLVQTFTAFRAGEGRTYEIKAPAAVSRIPAPWKFGTNAPLAWERDGAALRTSQPALATRFFTAAEAPRHPVTVRWQERGKSLRVENASDMELVGGRLFLQDVVCTIETVPARSERVVPLGTSESFMLWERSLHPKRNPGLWFDPDRDDVPPDKAGWYFTFYEKLAPSQDWMGGRSIRRLRARGIDLSPALARGQPVFVAEFHRDVTGLTLDRGVSVDLRGLLRRIVE